MKKKILFYRWVDPLVPADILDEVYRKEASDSDEEQAYAKIREQFNDEERPKISPFRGHYVSGPIGLVPMSEALLPSKNFNFWMAHCNFDIGLKEAKMLDEIEGIEIVRIFTRYRFWFAIGKAFDENDVMKSITDKLASDDNGKQHIKTIPPTEEENIDALIKVASKKNPHWAIVFTDDGYKIVGDKNEEKVYNQLEKYGDSVIIASWDMKKEDNGNGN